MIVLLLLFCCTLSRSPVLPALLQSCGISGFAGVGPRFCWNALILLCMFEMRNWNDSKRPPTKKTGNNFEKIQTLITSERSGTGVYVRRGNRHGNMSAWDDAGHLIRMQVPVYWFYIAGQKFTWMVPLFWLCVEPVYYVKAVNAFKVAQMSSSYLFLNRIKSASYMATNSCGRWLQRGVKEV